MFFLLLLKQLILKNVDQDAAIVKKVNILDYNDLDHKDMACVSFVSSLIFQLLT